MRFTACMITIFVGLVSVAQAATPEEAYLEARDKYIRDIDAMEQANAAQDKVTAVYEKAEADLKKQLRAILADVSVKGFSGPVQLNLEALSNSGVGVGMLDGLVFSEGAVGKPELVVTTRLLFDKWLASQAAEVNSVRRLPADLQQALGLDDFYTYSIGQDAAFVRKANLDVTAPAGVGMARAVLGGWTQAEDGPNPEQWVIVTLIKGDRVYFGRMRAKTAIKEIPACTAIWTRSRQKAAKIDADYEAAKRKGKPVDADEADKKRQTAEEEGARDYRACSIERTPKEAYYPALVKEAQAFVERIVGK
jgi:hypothetical protein